MTLRPPHFAICALIALILAGCGGPMRWTETRTTASLRYNDVARSLEEASAEVRAMCGEAEVLSVSGPVPVTGPDGEVLQEVTATCLATYDGQGNLIENFD